MSETYGVTGGLPGTSATIRAGGAVAVSAAFARTVGYVGGMDVSNGNATPGTVVTVQSSAEAATEFGENSELKRQADLAFSNGAATVYAVGVEETSNSESISGSGTLSNVPAFDPNVQPEHDITDNNGNDVNISYDPASETVSGTEVYVNPVDGTVEGDSGTTYDIQYDYGDYENATAEVVKKVPRTVAALTEAPSVINNLLGELNTLDQDFDFSHGFGGAMPESSASGYSDSIDDRRVAITAASRGYLDAAETEEVRLCGAVAGAQAGQSLGDSLTAEAINGIVSLRTDYTNSEVTTLIDSQVMPIKQRGTVDVVKDVNTSTESRFERVYASEIIDEVTQISEELSNDFIGDRNTPENRSLLEAAHRTSYNELVEDDLLEAFFVSVDEGANDFEAVVDIGIDVVGVIDVVDVTITVGDIVQSGGAN